MTVISVVAAAEDHAPWLEYTLKLIGEVAGLREPLRLVAPAEAADDGSLIYYGLHSPGGTAPSIPRSPKYRPSRMTFVEVDCGFDRSSEVLVYSDTIESAGALRDGRVAGFDLFFNFFAYVSCLEEYEHESRHGPVHSYAARLPGDGRRFDRPYANFLALQFRRIAAAVCPEGVRPDPAVPRLIVTHDIDVTEKTAITRLKEGGFRLLNILRSLASGRWPAVASQTKGLARMLFSRDDYFQLNKIAALEDEFGVRSIFNVFAGTSGLDAFERFGSRLFDPTYDMARHPRLVPALRNLVANDHQVGVHFSFHSWRCSARMSRERRVIENLLDTGPIVSCRQHWFRFSLKETWRAQWEAGILVDTTLGFTDRPGFRAGLAASFHPYDHQAGKAHEIITVPTVLMDTHLFYYDNLDGREAIEVIQRLVDDIRDVGGTACVIWHTHSFSRDHGWLGEFRQLLLMMRQAGISDGGGLVAGRPPMGKPLAAEFPVDDTWRRIKA